MQKLQFSKIVAKNILERNNEAYDYSVVASVRWEKWRLNTETSLFFSLPSKLFLLINLFFMHSQPLDEEYEKWFFFLFKICKYYY
jgi:hypothetical protein